MLPNAVLTLLGGRGGGPHRRPVTTLSDSALIPLSLAGFGLLAGATSVATACAAFGGAFLLQMAFTLSRRQVRHVRADGSVAANHPMDGASHANSQ